MFPSAFCRLRTQHSRHVQGTEITPECSRSRLCSFAINFPISRVLHQILRERLGDFPGDKVHIHEGCFPVSTCSTQFIALTAHLRVPTVARVGLPAPQPPSCSLPLSVPLLCLRPHFLHPSKAVSRWIPPLGLATSPSPPSHQFAKAPFACATGSTVCLSRAVSLPVGRQFPKDKVRLPLWFSNSLRLRRHH